ncbi:hypothetical protein SNE40_002894 [Patella caerulea]|uniref:Uncharacterized protein n=1 Tax=Patella caerulea TaxID=87958 RepID=A0AAN8KGV4_PATCE
MKAYRFDAWIQEKFTKDKKTSLQTLDTETALKLNLIPGQKLCSRCSAKCLGENSDETVEKEDSFLIKSEVCDQLNTSFTLIGCSPFKPHASHPVAYAKRKLDQVQESAKQKISQMIDIDTKDLDPTASTSDCKDCQNFRIFINTLKAKCAISSRQEKVKLLTLVPDKWSTEKTRTEFNVSKRLVQSAKRLKLEKGILASPDAKRGKTLENGVEERMVSFYQNDVTSRPCPGKKDFVLVKINNKRLHK